MMAMECGLAIGVNDTLSSSNETLFFVDECYFDIKRFAELILNNEGNNNDSTL